MIDVEGLVAMQFGCTHLDPEVAIILNDMKLLLIPPGAAVIPTAALLLIFVLAFHNPRRRHHHQTHQKMALERMHIHGFLVLRL